MNPQTSALLTDYYQLTMLDGYVVQGMHDTAVFEFYVRKLPRQRNFLIAAGLEHVLRYLEQLHFTSDELEWLEDSESFSDSLLEYLSGFRFTGDVDAMPEGTIFFPDEPILRITAPMPQAQFVESRIINLLHFQSLIASKAARCVLAAPPGRLLVDFGMRRAHGADAGLLASRAGYIAGMSGTATVLAAATYDIPPYGTMAHSFVEAHDDEFEAFLNFANAQPEDLVLLIDTYDVEAATRKVTTLASMLRERDIVVRGVRIDSGDLIAHSRKVRRILDVAGHPEITIFVSGDIDEYELLAIGNSQAPIDGFGIGTHLETSADAPYLDCAYKLQEYAGVPRRKRSEGKATWPGRKQVYRQLDAHGYLDHDLLTTADDRESGEPLIQPVMRGGKRLHPVMPLTRIREYAAAQLQTLPPDLRSIERRADYEVRVAPTLTELASQAGEAVVPPN